MNESQPDAAAAASAESDSEPLSFSAHFPSSPFNNVVIGEGTQLAINVTNSGSQNYTVLALAGLLVNPNNFTNVARNLTGFRYGKVVPKGETVELPYWFRVDAEEGEWGLVVMAELMDQVKN